MNHQVKNDTKPGIIIVDDHPLIVEGLQILLANHRSCLIVDTADSQSSAYKSYSIHHPELMVIDLSISNGHGLCLCRRIRAQDPYIRILIYTMHDSQSLRQKAFSCGANAYLCKTASAKELRQTIEVLLKTNGQGKGNLTQTGDVEASEIDCLTAREFEVFLLLAEGEPVSEVASTLSISPKTVGVHQTRIMKKLEISNLAQLTRIAIRGGYIIP